MKSIALLLLLAAPAWGIPSIDILTTVVRDDSSIRLLKILKSSSTCCPYTEEITLHEDSWYVMKGSQTYTLDEFVQSGRFCEFRGRHDEYDASYSCGPGKVICKFCERCRIRTVREAADWERAQKP